jgi:hypothetical protein
MPAPMSAGNQRRRSVRRSLNITALTPPLSPVWTLSSIALTDQAQGCQHHFRLHRVLDWLSDRPPPGGKELTPDGVVLYIELGSEGPESPTAFRKRRWYEEPGLTPRAVW